MPQPEFPFDPDWYRGAYPDVEGAVSQGHIASLEQHYLDFGSREGRLPVPPQPENGRVFAYGSFGSNNVGDEAILEGIRCLYPRCVQFVSNRPRDGHGEFAQTAIRMPGFFRQGDYLIIGGGGLLYDRPTVTLMANLARAARLAGATVDILRLGCEAAQASYVAEIKRLVSHARHVTVRSSLSREIMLRLTGREVTVEADFAFLLRPEVAALPRALCEVPTIGLVTATTSLAEIREIAAVIRAHTDKSAKPLHFVHIPHSRSYFNLENNDRITGEEIWTSAHMHHARDMQAFEPLSYEGDPRRLLTRYKTLDGVVSSRYHGLVFAALTDIPALALGGNLLKLRGFLSDHPSPLLRETTADGLAKDFPAFMQVVLATRDARRGAFSGSTRGAEIAATAEVG
jgi:polysaccharide pyruvyl transferase WcaK-like protein